jgi:ABC-type phosphate transport system substrate-binding protein
MMMSKIRTIAGGLALFAFFSGAAQAGMAIIAHPSNPIAGISAEETAKIYLGKSASFDNGRAATPVDQTAGPTRTKFNAQVLQKDDRELKAYWSKLLFTGKGRPPEEIGDDAAVKAWVAKTPSALGYVDGKVVDSSVKVLLIVP